MMLTQDAKFLSTILLANVLAVSRSGVVTYTMELVPGTYGGDDDIIDDVIANDLLEMMPNKERPITNLFNVMFR